VETSSRFTAWHWVALGAYAVLFVGTWWQPIWPREQALHHSLSVLALIGVVWVQRRYPLPLTSWLLIRAFLSLHTIAARWIYSFVPYDDWLDGLFGFRLSTAFGWRRNAFDRLVHLSYGLCLTPVLARYLESARGWRKGWAIVASVQTVVATGALYELFEWLIAIGLAPKEAEAYNGQQGDIWDSQKDMAIALAGAVFAGGVLGLNGLRKRRRGQGSGALRSDAEGGV
jgi:putative membrane protein